MKSVKHLERLFCLTLLAVLVACGGVQETKVEVGALAPSFTLKDLDGHQVESQALAGKPLVVNFWATWCQPCRKEIPELAALQDSGVEVVSIALDEGGAASVRPFVEKHGIEYTVLLGDQDLFERYNGLTIPYTLALDAEQKVVGIYRGAMRREAVERDLGSVTLVESDKPSGDKVQTGV